MCQVVECVPNFSEGRDQKVRLKIPSSCAVNATCNEIACFRFRRLSVSQCLILVGRDSSVGIATRYGLEGPGIESRLGEIFCTHPDRPWGPPSLLYHGYRVFPGGKAAGACVDHPPHLAPRLKKE
jgi:hypothetical protein